MDGFGFVGHLKDRVEFSTPTIMMLTSVVNGAMRRAARNWESLPI